MKIYRTKFVFTLLSFIVVVFLSNCEVAPTNPAVDPLIYDTTTIDTVYAPDFTLKGIDGNIVSLDDYKDKTLLLFFWDTKCAPCRRIFPDMVRLYTTYKEKGFDVVGVVVERPENGVLNTVRKMQEVYGVEFALAWYDNRVINDYGPIESLPRAFFIDKNKRIVSDIEGARQYSFYESALVKLLDMKPE